MAAKICKRCFVPTCMKDSIKNPNTIFVRIPEKLRENWCRKVNAKYYKDSIMFCCEDHFDLQIDLRNYYKHKLMNEEPKFKPTALLRYTDITPGGSTDSSELMNTLLLPDKRKYEEISVPTTSTCSTSGSTRPTKLENDMENYTQLKIMGSVKRIRMKPNCVPSRFDCQVDRKYKSTPSEPRPALKKRQRISTIKDIEETIENEKYDVSLPSCSQDLVVPEMTKNNGEAVQVVPTQVPSVPVSQPGTSEGAITPSAVEVLSSDDVCDESVALPRCAECEHRIKDCVLVCVQCADSKWCSACADLALHPRHYLIRVPANRPQNEINEVLKSLRLILAKQTATSDETAVHADKLIENESENATAINEIKEENEIFEESSTFAEERSDDVTHPELGLALTNTEEMVYVVKKELEEVDPLMPSADIVPESHVKLESDFDCTLDPSTGGLCTEPDPSRIDVSVDASILHNPTFRDRTLKPPKTPIPLIQLQARYWAGNDQPNTEELTKYTYRQKKVNILRTSGPSRLRTGGRNFSSLN